MESEGCENGGRGEQVVLSRTYGQNSHAIKGGDACPSGRRSSRGKGFTTRGRGGGRRFQYKREGKWLKAGNGKEGG